MSERRTEYLPLSELQPDPRNPKGHDLGTMDLSMMRFGYVDAITRDDRTGHIISGHGRRESLMLRRDNGERAPDGVKVRDDGEWLVPVTVGWSSHNDTEAAAALIALNRTTELGGWVDEALMETLDTLNRYEELVGTGFDAEQIDSLRNRLEEFENDGGDTDPWDDRKFQAKPDPGIVEQGQIWKIGPHLLACGDSRDPSVWQRMLNGKTADMVFTDPPYGIDYDGGGVERERLEGDGSADEAVKLLGDVFDTLTKHAVRPGTVSYVCLSQGDAYPVMSMALLDRELYRWMLIWVKDRSTFGRSDYHQRHEPIVYGWWPGGAHHAVEDRKQNSVWEIPRPKDSDRHPTAKPPELAERAIQNSCPAGGIVAEPFAGSGSTLIAAHRAGRVGVGCEWEPGYVSGAIKWLTEEVGTEAILISSTGGGDSR